MRASRKKFAAARKPKVAPATAATDGSTARIVRWLVPAAIVLLTSAVFTPVLQNGFVNWDDDGNLVENLNYRGLGWPHLSWMFTTFYGGHYQPLTWLTFGFDYLLWGMEPFGYHLTNLVLHAANALFFYFLTLRLLAATLSRHDPPHDLFVRLGSGLAALLFAIHPLRVESVAWATERRDVLSALFLFSCVLCYLRAVTVSPGVAHSRWQIGAILFYGLSLLSKAIGITLPVILLVLDVYPLKRLRAETGKGLGAIRREVLSEKIPFLCLAVITTFIAATAQGGVMRTINDHGVGARLAQAMFGLAFYLWKTIFPVGLSPLYELPENFNPLDWRFLASGFMVVGITIFLFVVRRRWPAGLTSWVCYGVMLAPVLGIAQSGPQIVADRYSYLSCLGWAILAGAAPLSFRQFRWRIAKLPALAAGTALVVVVVLGLLTWKQAQVWHDSEGLWRHVLSIMENSYFRPSIAHNNLGVALLSRGDVEGAIQHYRESVRINPAYAEAHNNLGNAFFRRNESAEAIRHYRDAVRINPVYAEAYYNLGNALVKQNQAEEAMQSYREALRLNPSDARAHYNIGTILARGGQLEEAIQSFRQALQIDPAYAQAHFNLATALAINGQLSQATEHFRQALSSDADNAAFHAALAKVLVLQGNSAEATQHEQEAQRIMKSRSEPPIRP